MKDLRRKEDWKEGDVFFGVITRYTPSMFKATLK
jgi:hypothetical protein